LFPSSFINVRKSTLEVKFALPAILMHANLSPTNTINFAEGMFIEGGLQK
jgi:hypothetical protein